MAPHAYLTQLRMQEAAAQLREGDEGLAAYRTRLIQEPSAYGCASAYSSAAVTAATCASMHCSGVARGLSG